MTIEIPQTMKALQITRPDPTLPPALISTTLPVPLPKPNHVLVKVRASAINPSDLINIAGGFPATTFPRVPGRDFAGTVAAAPSNPSLVGKEIYATSGPEVSFIIDGSFAEYVLVPEELVAEKPSNLSFVEAAGVGVPFTTASIALKRATALEGETVLVLGATGVVGLAVVQIAKAKGCNVLRGARSDGADVNLKSDPSLSIAKEKSGGKGPDVVIDTTGDLTLINAALQVLAPNGRLSYIAAPRTGSTSIQLDVQDHYRRQLSLVGCNSLTWSAKSMGDMLNELKGLFEKGALKAVEEKGFEKFGIGKGLEAYAATKDRKVRKAVIVFE